MQDHEATRSAAILISAPPLPATGSPQVGICCSMPGPHTEEERAVAHLVRK